MRAAGPKVASCRCAVRQRLGLRGLRHGSLVRLGDHLRMLAGDGAQVQRMPSYDAHCGGGCGGSRGGAAGGAGGAGGAFSGSQSGASEAVKGGMSWYGRERCVSMTSASIPDPCAYRPSVGVFSRGARHDDAIRMSVRMASLAKQSLHIALLSCLGPHCAAPSTFLFWCFPATTRARRSTTVPQEKQPFEVFEGWRCAGLPAGTTAAASRLLLPLPFEPFDCPRSSVTVTDGIASLPLLPRGGASTIDDASVVALGESSTLFRCTCWVHGGCSRSDHEVHLPIGCKRLYFRHRVATEQKKKKRKK